LIGVGGAGKRFFLKKEAKTLAHWHARWTGLGALEGKSFLVLFFKKEPLSLHF
jgi:hypothetical protein